MEHSKLRSLSLSCDACQRMWSLSDEDFQSKIIKCQNPECENEFSIYEGMRSGLKIHGDFIPSPFLANDVFRELIEIKVGYSSPVQLPESIKRVFKVLTFPLGNFEAGASDLDSKGFRLMTSLSEGLNPDSIGETSKVMVMVHARTDDYEEPWLHMLQYALGQYASEDYITCILLSEIAFETYLDLAIGFGYRAMGLDEDSINRLLKANIPDKANALMNNVYNVKLSSNKELFKSWEKVLTLRNSIAHGRKNTASQEEARVAYSVIVDAIFHFVEALDNKSAE